MFRRGREETPPIALEGVEDARRLAAEIREKAGRLRATPGLLDGALEELHGTLERLLREYARMSRRRFKEFERELDQVAKRAQELEGLGRLAPRHARLVNQALQHARRVHYWNARRVLDRLAKTLAPAREWREAAEAYRSFHRKAALRVRTAEETLGRLRGVPRPTVSPQDVTAARSLLEACNRAADEAWLRQTHRPVGEVLRDLTVHPDVEGLGLLSTIEFASLRELSDLFEAQPAVQEALGTLPLAELVASSGYSAAKWDRVYPQAVLERRKLQDLFHHIRPVVTGAHGVTFAKDLGAEVLHRRVAAWRQFPGAEGMAAWRELDALVGEGRWRTVQESAKTYERFRELAERAWDGSLAAEVKEQEEELSAARTALERLPTPDSLTP